MPCDIQVPGNESLQEQGLCWEGNWWFAGRDWRQKWQIVMNNYEANDHNGNKDACLCLYSALQFMEMIPEMQMWIWLRRIKWSDVINNHMLKRREACHLCVCVFLGKACCYQSGEDAQYLTCWQHQIQDSQLRGCHTALRTRGGQNIDPRNGLKNPVQQASCSKCQGLFLANIYLTLKDSVEALNPQWDSARASSTWEAGF